MSWQRRLHLLRAKIWSMGSEVTDGWVKFYKWFVSTTITWPPSQRMLVRFDVLSSAGLLVYSCYRAVIAQTLFRGVVAYIVALISGIALCFVFGSVILVHNSRKIQKRNGGVGRKTQSRLGRLVTRVFQFAVLLIPAWLILNLASEVTDILTAIAAETTVWFWLLLPVLMVIPVLKFKESLQKWIDKREERRHLSHAFKESQELLLAVAPLAAADRLTATALCDLLDIALGDELPSEVHSARTVLTALNADPSAVRLSRTLEMVEMERIWSATEKLRIARFRRRWEEELRRRKESDA
jgi:hypothetical protein